MTFVKYLKSWFDVNCYPINFTQTRKVLILSIFELLVILIFNCCSHFSQSENKESEYNNCDSIYRKIKTINDSISNLYDFLINNKPRLSDNDRYYMVEYIIENKISSSKLRSNKFKILKLSNPESDTCKLNLKFLTYLNNDFSEFKKIYQCYHFMYFDETDSIGLTNIEFEHEHNMDTSTIDYRRMLTIKDIELKYSICDSLNSAWVKKLESDIMLFKFRISNTLNHLKHKLNKEELDRVIDYVIPRYEKWIEDDCQFILSSSFRNGGNTYRMVELNYRYYNYSNFLFFLDEIAKGVHP